MITEDNYLRHTLPLLFDVPADRASRHPQRLAEVLNIITAKIIETIDRDDDIQDLLRRNHIDWGLGTGSWETDAGAD